MTSPPIPEMLKCCLCGRELAAERRLQHDGGDYCLECAGAAVKQEQIRRQGFRRSPGLAAFLSLLPGLGQMYSGQLTKGVILLIAFFALSGITSQQHEFGLFIPVLILWNMFDAYWMARRINEGEGLTELLPEDRLPEIEVRWESAATPAWGGLLIVLGILLLLNNFGVTALTYKLIWPIAILLMGIWLLYTFAVSRKSPANNQESDHGEN
jgi:hypothetical protein